MQSIGGKYKSHLGFIIPKKGSCRYKGWVVCAVTSYTLQKPTRCGVWELRWLLQIKTSTQKREEAELGRRGS